MKFDFATISVLLAGLVPLLALVVALAIDRWKRKRTEKPPQVEKLLRPAGYSLAIRLDETMDAVLLNIVIACGLGGFAGASTITLIKILAAHVPALWAFVSGSLVVVFVAAALIMTKRAFFRLRKFQDIQLGLRGEQAVAEALHEVADCGFRAFHDFPGGRNWNIDHVAVGARGVFLIETKARRRRGRGQNGQAAHKVIYDGENLVFPSGWDAKAIEQAKMNAKWLSNYLEKKTGEPVRVEPVVVLPGWYVRFSEKGNFPVKVMNTSYLTKFLRGQTESIEAAQVRRIITALDEKCRDVEF
jgi:hypothetical protein